MKWEKVKVDHIKATGKYSLVGGPFGSDLVSKDYVEKGVPVLRGANLPFGKRFSHENLVFVSEEKALKLKANIAYPKDIIFTQRGTLGQVGIIPMGFYEEYVVSQSQMKLTVNEELAIPEFVYYYFSSEDGRNSIKAHSITSGVPHINLTILKDLEILLPCLPTQCKIASILSAYDDLIENNLKRIKLLEEKAFLRYQQIVSEAPLKYYKLKDITQVLKRGISAKYVSDEGIVVLNQKCIRNHIVSFEQARLTDLEKKPSPERMLQKFDTLINSTGTGTLGRMAMNIQDEIELTVDSHVTIVRAGILIRPIFLSQSLFAQENRIEGMGEGSTNQTELSARKLGEEISIGIPPMESMVEFENEAEFIFNLIWNLQKQNTKLREARDILLPKLMNGQMHV